MSTIISSSDVASKTGLTREIARVFLTFLVGAGAAKEAGTRPAPAGKKGRGENLYELTDDAASVVASVMDKVCKQDVENG